MATDLLIDDDDDIAFDGQDIDITEGIETIAQRLYVKLQTFKGTWFLDPNFGVPYYQFILGKDFTASTLNAIFIEAILTTPGVQKLAAPIEYLWDGPTRNLNVKFTAITTTGQSVPIELPGIAG